MSTVAEQLQKYRAMTARQKEALQQHHPLVVPRAVSCTHPNTSEYFRALMQRWQSRADSHPSLASSK